MGWSHRAGLFQASKRSRPRQTSHFRELNDPMSVETGFFQLSKEVCQALAMLFLASKSLGQR